MRHRHHRLVSLVLVLVLALAIGTSAAIAKPNAPPASHPALWKLADADTTIYLFGTVHVLPPHYSWRDPAIDRAIASAQTLTLETILDEEPGRIARALTALGRQAGLPPLLQRVPPKRRAGLAKLIQASGMPAAGLDGFKTWAAAIVLTGPALAQIGIAAGGDNGVEPQLTGAFRGAGKPVDGLETPEQQLGYFDALPEAAQREFLSETVDDPARTRKDFAAMLRAWSSGNVPAIARAFAEDAEFTPALRDLLVKRRNTLWAAALAKRLEQPGTVFVAVGAGHLAGPDALQAMLAAKGLKVVRVQ